MQLIRNSFFAPYFIFVKDDSNLNDEELFKKIGLKDYQLVTNKDEKKPKGKKTNKRYLYITEDEKWKHIMDDWLYTLWHDKEVKSIIKNLSKEFDIFCCSIGDCDDSFDFVYYQNGIERREYIVEDLQFKGGEVKKDFGEPFEIEKIALEKKDLFEKILTIAKHLGIDTCHNLEKIRCYGRVEKESEKLTFNEDEY
jgi:hypothetical protein